jgi:hypothetical protein
VGQLSGALIVLAGACISFLSFVLIIAIYLWCEKKIKKEIFAKRNVILDVT